MQKTIFGDLSVFQFDKLNKEPNIKHCITTKKGWKTGNTPRLPVSDEYPWQEYKKELACAMGITDKQLFAPQQTHSDSIAIITKDTSPENLIGKDALITNKKGLCLTIQTADCVPILLFDPKNKAIGNIHAGWRGTVKKIVQKTIAKMQTEYGTSPSDLIAGIGPSIHKNIYEVGNDVISLIVEHFSDSRNLLSPSKKEGKAFFDLWEANRITMLDAGMLAEKIEIMGMCSYEHEHLFFSARRDGANPGRNISCLMLQ